MINGQRLADLMIEQGVGVSHRETFSLVDVDSDYFEDS
jgi:restriction endonuclease Mrr